MPSSQRNLIARLARDKGLTIVGPEALTLRRQRCGKGFVFVQAMGAQVRDKGEIARLKSLAVPPAYTNVRFAADATSHLQAVGEDAAGRLQYRYHPQWAEVREALKARRLAGLARALPAIRRAVGRGLGGTETDLGFAASAVVELVRLTSIRAGGESYAREHGTRGATTLLKSDIQVDRDRISLRFKAKGGAAVAKDIRAARFALAIARLIDLPGRRLFQYRDRQGTVRTIRAPDVNKFLQQVAGCRISLKDFRTLVASGGVLDALSATAPASNERARRSQVRAAVMAAAEELTNTPTVCRTSYVHDAIVAAFEAGKLNRSGKPTRTAAEKAEALARIVSRHAS